MSKTTNKFSTEVRARAVRMVLDHAGDGIPRRYSRQTLAHHGFNGLYQAEVIHRRGPWRSFEAVEFATLEWLGRFNRRRLLEPIGNIPPAEAEQNYGAMMDNS